MDDLIAGCGRQTEGSAAQDAGRQVALQESKQWLRFDELAQVAEAAEASQEPRTPYLPPISNTLNDWRWRGQRSGGTEMAMFSTLYMTVNTRPEIT